MTGLVLVTVHTYKLAEKKIQALLKIITSLLTLFPQEQGKINTYLVLHGNLFST